MHFRLCVGVCPRPPRPDHLAIPEHCTLTDLEIFCKCHSGFEQIMWSGGTGAALPSGFVDTNSYLDPARWRDGGKTKKPKNCFHCSLPVFFWASACPSNQLDDSLLNSPWWREIETDSSWFTNWNDNNFKHLVRGGVWRIWATKMKTTTTKPEGATQTRYLDTLFYTSCPLNSHYNKVINQPAYPVPETAHNLVILEFDRSL